MSIDELTVESTPEYEAYEIIRRTVLRIESPERWCQGTAARDHVGIPVDPRSDRACRWCLGGAFFVESYGGDERGWGIAHGYLFAAIHEADPRARTISGFNDRRGHARVIATALRALAIAAARPRRPDHDRAV